MGYETIQVGTKFDGQVGEASLAAPPANILTAKMMAELAAWLAAEARERRRKLLVVSGQGKHFSYGASVEEHLPERVGTMLPAFHRLIDDTLACPVPVLARVSGLCLGGGFELALACGLLFADETAKFGVPEIQLGVFPPVAAALLPSRCGGALATRLILTGEKVAARELLAAGLVSLVAPEGRLDADLSAFVERQILPTSASSIRLAHRAAKMEVLERYRALIPRLESLYLGELMATRDAAEGIRAFVEKRAPSWSDR